LNADLPAGVFESDPLIVVDNPEKEKLLPLESGGFLGAAKLGEIAHVDRKIGATDALDRFAILYYPNICNICKPL
jgi:hypothetical protein